MNHLYQNPMEKVIAVVVSYNRHALLVECIEAIRKQSRQPDAILVVNNGSADYSSVWLDKQEDIIHLYQENSGSAGGFKAGLQWAYEHGFTWIWCLDDDGYPKENALEALLATNETQPVLINCAVINKEDKKSFVWKTANYKTLNEVKENILEGVAHPFNGSLIHRLVIERVGLPDSSLFHRGEEAEYYYRITRRHQIRALTVTSAVYYHPSTKYSYKKEWNLNESWSTFYHVRNQLAILKTKYDNTALALCGYLIFMTKFVLSVLVYQRSNVLGKLSFTAWAFMDALLKDHSATPKLIQYKIKHQYTASLTKLLLLPIKNMLHSILFPSITDANTAVTM